MKEAEAVEIVDKWDLDPNKYDTDPSRKDQILQRNKYQD